MPARSAVMRNPIAPGVHGPIAIIRDGQRRILAREQQVCGAIDNAFGAAKDHVMPVLGVVVRGYEHNLTKAQQEAKDRGDDPNSARAKPDHVATENLMAIVEKEMGTFGDQAGVYIAGGQRDAIYQGRGDSQAATESAMQQVMDFLRGEWFFRPNDDAIHELMGKASDGNTPLASLLQGLGQSAASLLQETLTAGLAAGTNPREVGRQLEDALNMPRNRAQVIARNEMVDSYREAALANYSENSDVLDGWLWCAELGPRTCFPAGTLITTKLGAMPIEDVATGDYVRTHKGRWQRVDETLQRPYEGLFVTIVAGDRRIIATENHPFLVERQGKLNWIEATQLCLGDRVVCERDGSTQIGNHIMGDGTIERRVRQPYNRVAFRLQQQRLARICRLGTRRGMPVDAINLKHGVHARQEEVNRIAPTWHGMLLSVVYAHLLKTTTHIGLRFCLAGEPPVALYRAEAPNSIGRWHNAVRLAAGQALTHHRWASAFFRAVTQVRTALIKDAPTPLTGSMDGIDELACCGTVDTLSFAGIGSEFLAADNAGVLGARMLLTTGDGAICALPCVRDREDRSTSLAHHFNTGLGRLSRSTVRMLMLIGSIARHRAEVASALPDMGGRNVEYSATSLANAFHTHIISYITYHTQPQTVYNLEVEGDHSYIANGFAVHNCSMCIAMNGQAFPLDEPFDSHACCRCAPVPATQGWQDIADGLGIDTEDLDLSDLEDTSVELPDGQEWLNRQPPATQQQIMGKGKLALWKADMLKLSDLVAKGKHPQWGGYRYEPSLKDLGFTKEDISKATAKITPDTTQPAAPPTLLPTDTLKLLAANDLYTASEDVRDAINYGHDGARGADLRSQLAEELTARLTDNPAWHAMVEQAKGPLAGMTEPELAQFLLSAWTAGSAGDMLVTHALKRAIEAEFQLSGAATEHIPPESIQAFTEKYGGDGAGLQAFARAMYDNTQAWFKAQGITEVPAYRGVRFPAGAAPEGLPVDGEIHAVDVRLQPGSSFSVMADMASNFGTRNGAGESVVMAGMMPVERILSTPQSGVGMKFEGEMVLLGGTTRLWEMGVHGHAIPEDFAEKAQALLAKEAHATKPQDDFLADTGPSAAKSSAPMPLHTLAELRAMYPDDAPLRDALAKQSMPSLKAQAKEEGITLPKGKTAKSAIIDAIVQHVPIEAPPLDDYARAQADEATAKKVLAQAKRDVTAATKAGDEQAIHIAEDKMSTAKASYDQAVAARKTLEPAPDLAQMAQLPDFEKTLGKMGIADLRQMATDAGVALSGKTKAAIVASIVEHFATPVPEAIDGIQPFQRVATTITAHQFTANGPVPPGAERLADGRVVTHGLEGDQEVKTGDWVVQGVNGEYYPIHADSFATLYEAHADGTPGKFSRIPEQVQAFQWDGKPVAGFTIGKDAQGHPTLTVPLRGRDPLHVPPGNWIVHGETGWRAVAPDVFAKTFEAAKTEEATSWLTQRGTMTVASENARIIAISARLKVRDDYVVPQYGGKKNMPDPFDRASEHNLRIANDLYGSAQLADYIYAIAVPLIAGKPAMMEEARHWGIDPKNMSREDMARAIAEKYLATHERTLGPPSHLDDVQVVKGTKTPKEPLSPPQTAPGDDNQTPQRRGYKPGEGRVTALFAINERTLRDPFLLPDVRQYHRMYGDDQLPIALDNLMADTLKRMANDWQSAHPESGAPASRTKRADLIDYLVKSVQTHDGLITSQADVDRLMARDPINDAVKVNHAPTWGDIQKMTPIAGPHGSQEGQWYRDKQSGQEYYAKPAQSDAHAWNEVASMRVYEAMGAMPGRDIPYTSVMKDASGQRYIVSEKLNSLETKSSDWWRSDAAAPTRAEAEKLWAADVLLAHWDTAGLTHDNMLVDAAGHPIRIETGGAMGFRAQGGAKGSWKPGSALDEAWTMRGKDHGGVRGNQQDGDIFGQISDAHAAELLGDAARAINLDALRQAWKDLGMPKGQIDRNLKVIQARIDAIPKVQQELTKDITEGHDTLHLVSGDDLQTRQIQALEAVKVPPDHVADTLASRLSGNDAFTHLAQSLGRPPEELASTFIEAWERGGTSNIPFYAFQNAINDEFTLADAHTPNAQYHHPYQDAIRAFVRVMYDQTQEYFKAQGITEIPAYRGMGLSDPLDSIAFDGARHDVEIRLQPGSSFSVNPDIAVDFAGRASDQYALVTGGMIPTDRILSMNHTGFGVRDEAEIVVLGGTVHLWGMGEKTSLEDRQNAKVSDAFTAEAKKILTPEAHGDQPTPAMPREPVRPENAPTSIETTSKASPVPDMPQHDAQAQEDWLNKERPGIDWTVADVHPDVLPQVVAKLDALRATYPEAYQYLDGVTTTGDWETYGAYAYVDGDGKTLHLNPTLFGDPARFEQQYQRDMEHAKPGSDLTWFVKTDLDPVQAIITHEFGHILDKYMRFNTEAFLHTISPSGIGQVSQTWRAMFETYMPRLQGKLSNYADQAYNDDGTPRRAIQIDTERFAELFVLIQSGEPIPGELGDIAAQVKTFLRLVAGTKRYSRDDYKLTSDILNPAQKAQAIEALQKLATILGIAY